MEFHAGNYLRPLSLKKSMQYFLRKQRRLTRASFLFPYGRRNEFPLFTTAGWHYNFKRYRVAGTIRMRIIRMQSCVWLDDNANLDFRLNLKGKIYYFIGWQCSRYQHNLLFKKSFTFIAGGMFGMGRITMPFFPLSFIAKVSISHVASRFLHFVMPVNLSRVWSKCIKASSRIVQ